MTVHLFSLRDFNILYRNRHDSVFFDTTLLLTRGPLLVQGALLSYLAPSLGIYTCVGKDEKGSKESILGQVIHNTSSNFSHLTFLSPSKAINSQATLKVIEFLVKTAGAKGATRMLADVEENHPAFDILRRLSFATYTRQRIWRVNKENLSDSTDSVWQPALNQDGNKIRSLYHNLVPGLVQQVEPFPLNNPQGMIFKKDGELMAYVELKYGPRGIWAQPFVHPDTQNVSGILNNLVVNIPYRRSRPIYICVRSYQFWLENSLETLGAEPGPIQAIVVKHLAISQKAKQSFEMPAIEGRHPEVTASIQSSKGK